MLASQLTQARSDATCDRRLGPGVLSLEASLQASRALPNLGEGSGVPFVFLHAAFCFDTEFALRL